MQQLTLHVDDVFAHLHPLFQAPGRRRIVEVGAHDGRHSDLIRLMCAERPHYLAIEPDPRNVRVMEDAGLAVTPYAASDRSGERVPWFASEGITPGTEARLHTDSSSFKRPTAHLTAHPWCAFREEGSVWLMTLDEMVERALDVEDDGESFDFSKGIDLVWVDVQGAQLEVIRGGRRTLGATRYLFIEVHPTPMYEGEPSFEELHDTLGHVTESSWRVVQTYPADVLLERVK